MDMDKAVDTALTNVLARIRPNMQADEAMKFTQSALNLAHVAMNLATLDAEANAEAREQRKLKGAGA